MGGSIRVYYSLADISFFSGIISWEIKKRDTTQEITNEAAMGLKVEGNQDKGEENNY